MRQFDAGIHIGNDYRGRTAIVLGMENDRPDRPIVQPVVIAWIVEDDRLNDLQGDTRYGSSRPIKSALLMWATFFQCWMILLRILRLLNDLESD